MTKIDYKHLMNEAEPIGGWRQHRFLVLVLGAIAIAIFMVLVAMNLYSSSGTAQLDLSRPDYQSVRSQAGREGAATEFPSTGALTPEVLEEFRALYKEKSDQVIKANGFSGQAMTDASLGLPKITR